MYLRLLVMLGPCSGVFIKKQIPKKDFSFRLELPHCVIEF